jgi:glycosyltransferase involved in cell wall biosynthesis
MTLPKRPLITVGIPAYNRATLLPVLLDSIFSQSGTDFEILICEDASPQREEIREVVRQYATKYPGVVSYYENSVNLGYDGNLRRLVALAKGDYVLFMGNDDLLADGALRAVANAVAVHPNVGVVLRSYDSFFDDPDCQCRHFDTLTKSVFSPLEKKQS